MSDITLQYSKSGEAAETEKLLPTQEKKGTIPSTLSITIDVPSVTERPPNWTDWKDGDPGCRHACSYCIFNVRPWVTWVSALCIGGGIRLVIAASYSIDYGGTLMAVLGAAALAPFIIIYLFSVMQSETWRKVLNATSRGQLEDKLRMLCRSTPRITWHLQYYHNDNSRAEVNYSNGSACAEMTKKKIVTWSGSKTFDFKGWKDVTHPFQLADSGSYQIISMHKKYIFADEETRAAYESQKQAFVEEHKHQDLLYSIKESFEFDGFEDKILAQVLGCGCTGSRVLYVLMMLLLLAYPWSFLVKKGERRLDYHCTKVVSVSHEKIIIEEIALQQTELLVPEAELDADDDIDEDADDPYYKKKKMVTPRRS